MAATPLQVYEAIKPKIGEKESQLLLEHIARQTEVSTKDLATKGDLDKLAGIVERLAVTVEKLTAGMEKFATKVDIKDMATKADIRDMATKADIREMATKTDLANLRAELLKWMFIFWVGQFAAIVGVVTAILFAFFKP